jgi:hypothetical protein
VHPDAGFNRSQMIDSDESNFLNFLDLSVYPVEKLTKNTIFQNISR